MDRTLADRALAKEKRFVPPPVNGDFYRIADLLDPKEQAVVRADARIHGGRSRADHRGLLGERPVSARDHPEARGARRPHRRDRVPGLRKRRRQLAAERPHRHGAGARRLVDRHLLGRSHRAFRRLDLSLRRREQKATLAAAR